MKHAIIGSGAIGIFYGTRLINAGEEVHFLLHSDYNFVEENGLNIVSNSLGNQTIKNINAYHNTSDMPVCDFVFVCLKTTENNKLLPSLLPPILGKETIIILIQNGLGVEEYIASLFPQQPIAGASAFISCHKIAPGSIQHLDHGDLVLGNYNVENTARLTSLAAIFSTQKIHCYLAESLAKLRWRKLVWNIAFNGMSVVLNAQTNKLMNSAYTIQLSREIMEEVVLGAKACGVILDTQLPEQMITYTQAMQPYSPSMKLDYDHRRPMEIYYIYEIPVLLARKKGYYMSKVDMLAKQLHFLEEEITEKKESILL